MTNQETCQKLLGFVPSGYILCCFHPTHDAGTVFVNGKPFASIPDIEMKLAEFARHHYAINGAYN